MADKKGKKPRHQNLYVPGDSKPKKGKKQPEPPREHTYTPAPTPPAESVAADESSNQGEGLAQAPMFDDDDGVVLSGMAAPPPQPAADPATDLGATPPKKATRKKKRNLFDELRGVDPWGKQAGSIPGNAVFMPKPKRTRLSAAKRRKLFKRVRRVAVLVLAVALLLFYTTGAYLTVANYVAEGFDSLRISLKGGDGFPVDYGIADYVKAEAMGENGMVVLGGSEASIFASNGTQLRYLQHTYLNPGVATGKSRAVLYSRGGKEYTVETRSKTVAKNTTDQEISFCSMSPDGRLAVVTSSRYRANLQVLAPPYNTADPLFNWPLVDDEPVALAFHSDNKSMVLGCLSAQNGALGTTLYLLRTDKTEVQTTIRADNATLLQLRYLDNHRVLAVYDTYTATYNSRGQELNRYDYSHRRLITSNIQDGRVALVFGTTTGEAVHTVLLDKSLEPQFDVGAQVLGTPKVMVVSDGVYLLCGQTLFAYTNQGALAVRTSYDSKLLGLAYAGQPLLVQQGQLTPIAGQLRQTPVEAAPSHLPSSTGAPESMSLPSSLPPESVTSALEGDPSLSEALPTEGEPAPEGEAEPDPET